MSKVAEEKVIVPDVWSDKKIERRIETLESRHSKQVQDLKERIEELEYALDGVEKAFWGGVVNIQHQNVMWSLLICVIMLYFMKKYRDFSVVFAGIACAIAWGIKCDYEYYGPLAVACMYLLRERTLYKNIATALIFSFEPAAIFALIPINMYNGEKGRSLKYLFCSKRVSVLSYL